MIKIIIDTSNDAFREDYTGEVARILIQAAGKFRKFGVMNVAPAIMPLKDINGNTVGTVELTEGDLHEF